MLIILIYIVFVKSILIIRSRMMKSGEFDVRNCIQNLRSVISKFQANSNYSISKTSYLFLLYP